MFSKCSLKSCDADPDPSVHATGHYLAGTSSVPWLVKKVVSLKV